MDKDYYQILNVPSSASQQQIKKAYVTLVKRFHPDRNPRDPGSDERTKSINEAYGVLKDRRRRLQYDRMRERGQMPDHTVPNDVDAEGRPFFQHLHTMMYFKKNPRALKNLALQAFNRGDYAFAESLLEQGIRLSPGDHELHMGLSWCLFHEGRYDRCARVLDTVLALNPKNVDAWFNLAWLQENDGDLAGALKTLKSALDHFPHMDELKHRIAVIDRKMK